MNTTILILIGLVVLLIVINIAAIWLTKKGLTKDENNNMIPDILEEKFAKMQADVSRRVSRVGEELKDVTKAIKEVGNKIGRAKCNERSKQIWEKIKKKMNYVQDTTAGEIKVNYIYVESKKNKCD